LEQGGEKMEKGFSKWIGLGAAVAERPGGPGLIRLVGLLLCGVLLSAGLFSPQLSAAPLADTVVRIKPSVVGIGTWMPTRSPRTQLLGTGFAVGDGLHVVTNNHVVNHGLDAGKHETYVVLIGRGLAVEKRNARVFARSAKVDLAVLRIQGAALKPMRVVHNNRIREGDDIAVTGYPLLQPMGLYSATYTGNLAALAPSAIPVEGSGYLDNGTLKKLRDPISLLQLDATVFPGNSGSPVYIPETGEVVGVISKMTIIKHGSLGKMDRPVGITFAVPSQYLLEMLPK
jgi:S1-C subfamily serine protease